MDDAYRIDMDAKVGARYDQGDVYKEEEGIHRRLDRIEGNQKQIMQALAKKKGVQFNYDSDENEERGNWTGKLDFLLSCLGYAVGLGNVWRFPYLCYKNGGGAFFIPYCLMLFLVGMPIFLLELTLGQFSSQGPLTCWGFSPIFKGIGFGMVIVSALVAIYYNIIIAWALYYLFASFNSVLPWQTCGDYSSPWCSTRLKPIALENCTSSQGLVAYANGTCYNETSGIPYGIYNESLAKNHSIQRTSASNEYLDFVGLQVKLSSGFGDFGPVRWDMTLCLLLAWIIIFLSLLKGIKSSGKVVYFTALFPYLVLIILFINGLLRDGYRDGIAFYLKPDLKKLQDAEVWKDAAVQIFFSLSASWGGLIALASYNRFKTDVVRDTLIVTIGNCSTSFFAGIVIFSYLGYLAKQLNTSVQDVVDSGVGLAFIVYPQAVTLLPAPPFWAILFFIMLITLGLDSQFTLVETVVTSISDQFPVLRKHKTLFLLCFCCVFFLLGLTMVTPGGMYMLTLMDDYSGGWNVMVISILECISVAWIYGALRFTNDIEVMTGPKVCHCIPWWVFKWWWISCWCVFSPILVLFIMIFSWVKYSPSKYGSYIFPPWANALGWLMTMWVVVSIFLPMVWMFCRAKGTFTERARKLFFPTKYWGPALVKFRKEITYVKGFEVDPWNKEPPEVDTTDQKYNKTENAYDNEAMQMY